MSLEQGIQPPSHIFFAGASWGCGFYIGVYKALQEQYGLDELAKIKWSGNSAGALIAMFSACGFDWNVAEKVYLDCLNKAIKSGVFGKMSDYHNSSLDIVFKKSDNFYQTMNGRLFLGVTTFIDEYHLISQWNNNKELRDCIHASMHIPYYSTHIEKIRVGDNMVRAFDGGFGKTYHRFNEKTLVVTALSNEGDIASNPPLHVLRDCYGPDLKKYYKMRDSGYNTMKQWDGKYKANKYVSSPPLLRKLGVLICWIPRITQEFRLKRLLFIVIVFLFVLKYRKRFSYKLLR